MKQIINRIKHIFGIHDVVVYTQKDCSGKYHFTNVFKCKYCDKFFKMRMYDGKLFEVVKETK